MHHNPRKININEYDYELPEERIAKYPKPERDSSSLLVYKEESIEQSIFRDIFEHLSSKDVLYLNNTKVLPARLFFNRSTGAKLEIFCLEPLNFSHQDAMALKASSTWKCLVGGAKKWKADESLIAKFQNAELDLICFAKMMSRTEEYFEIEFSWQPASFTFSEVLHFLGQIPLPPYFNRSADEEDTIRYQTIFAKSEGSVAAPTAGLHFTNELLSRLSNSGISIRNLTLHVGAGTFKPVSTETLENHEMHREIFSFSIEELLWLKDAHGQRIIPVGTTCMRSLESLYWIGKKISEGSIAQGDEVCLGQWECYSMERNLSFTNAIEAIINYCEISKQTVFTAATSIMIAPGYHFTICKGLVTNFHMPKSTLLVLVSALIGEDWKNVYDYALKNDFRFLSYGDSSLLLP